MILFLLTKFLAVSKESFKENVLNVRYICKYFWHTNYTNFTYYLPIELKDFDSTGYLSRRVDNVYQEAKRRKKVRINKIIIY